MQAVSVGAVMRHVNNFFESGYRATNYSIAASAITPSELLRPGMWIAITGSVFYDGVWQLGEGCSLGERAAGLPDETFFGRVYFLRPSKDFLALCERIAKFEQEMPLSALQSESFGVYSQTRASGQNGGVLTWQEAFKAELATYRNMFTEVL